MREEFEKLAVAGKIEGRQIEPLLQLATTGFCMHRSWGFGRIRTMDPVFARFTIDFSGKPGHTMDLAFAADTLKAISKEHILARKAADLEGLRQLAASDHVELVKVVLLSHGGRATADQIQALLVPDVIRDDWKKWWDCAKRELKKSGHFQVPLKKTDPIIYQAKEITLQDRLLEEFRAAKGLKARVAVTNEILRNAHDLSDPAAAATEIIAALNAEITAYQRNQPAVALEAIFARDDLRALARLGETAGELTARALWLEESKPGPILEGLPAAKHRRALDVFKETFPDRWSQILHDSLNSVPVKICREIANVLIHHGELPALKETITRLVSHHTASSEFLLWLGRERNDAFADILGPEVFRAMLSAMERDQFNEKRSNRLREFILDDQELIGELTAAADIEVIKDLTRALQFSPVFDDMDKRSLLARIVKRHPSIQTLITGEQTRQDTSFWVSWESLERRRLEYDELVHKKIPANSKEIAIARSYGDLSENHEYKAAKEMQKILMRRKEELEGQLTRARGTDFALPRAEDAVGIGTIVHATNLATGQSETFTILGAWDSKPEAGVISYLSPIAQSLLGHKPGDEVEFELEGAKHRHRIESVQAYRAVTETAPAAFVPPPAEASPVQPAA
ncbi:MAG TPA: GreA/GreB family elongation factor [Verrucomicrobiae bacterium]